MFLICSYFFTKTELRCSYKVCSYKKKSIFQFWEQILQICNFGSRPSILINILIISMLDLFWVPIFIKIRYITILRPNLPKFLISGQIPQFQIPYLWLTSFDLLWSSNFIALGIYSILGPFSWNEGIDTCFNVDCVLPGRNFDFHLVVIAR